jgi:perosamine synthetase
MPNINAAMGLAQLEVLPALLNAKRAIADRYRDVFSQLDGAWFLDAPEGSQSNYWLNNILLEPAMQDSRDAVLQELHLAGYQARPIWQPMHRLPMYSHCPRTSLEVTDSLYRRCISPPSSADLAPNWTDIVAEALAR